ncbi:uncharacterized protein ARB_07776 [Trichophyton benhamiae CBS 112371]|uniref:Uncharacterized protein n=1 Tax=Arthroderma benhamiae (strain ATCC MYA-4681 / CBS 112371) TaxID=663331 RepID=D4ATW3_ARTBC|nr:uncharacterized protein ARB_07776 [Trichophyton benhamiae CBS 112371]EFE33416.1 hypothetical protein ARB_07776 [Trichophyton benhamiae CBS 112371]
MESSHGSRQCDGRPRWSRSGRILWQSRSGQQWYHVSFLLKPISALIDPAACSGEGTISLSLLTPPPLSRWLCLCVYTPYFCSFCCCFSSFCRAFASSALPRRPLITSISSPAQPKGGTARPGDILTRSDSTGAPSIAGSSIARSLALHRSVWLRLLVGWVAGTYTYIYIYKKNTSPTDTSFGDQGRQRLEPATKRKPSHIACPPPRDGGEIDSALDETKIYTNIQPPQEEATRTKKKQASKKRRREEERKKKKEYRTLIDIRLPSLREFASGRQPTLSVSLFVLSTEKLDRKTEDRAIRQRQERDRRDRETALYPSRCSASRSLPELSL